MRCNTCENKIIINIKLACNSLLIHRSCVTILLFTNKSENGEPLFQHFENCITKKFTTFFKYENQKYQQKI